MNFGLFLPFFVNIISRYYGRTQKELIESARENFSKNRLFDRSYHSIRSIGNLNSIGSNNLIINGTQSLNRNLASRSTGALLIPGSTGIHGHGGSSTLSSNDSDQNYNLGNQNTSISAHHLSYNIPSSTAPTVANVQGNQSLVDKSALSVRSLDENLASDIGDMPYELAKASQLVVQNRKQRHLHDDTSTHGSRTIDSRYSNDKTLGLSDEDDNEDEEDNDDDDDDLDLENNGQLKSDTNNNVEDGGCEHEEEGSKRNRKVNKNGDGDAEVDERDNSIENEKPGETKVGVCPCGLKHDDMEIDGHNNLMPDAVGKLPSYLNKLGSMLEEKGNNSMYVGIDHDIVKLPIQTQTHHQKIGGLAPTTGNIKLDISVGSTNDTELVGSNHSQQSNPNKIYSRKEVITTSYCKEEIKNTHHEEYSTTYYESNKRSGQSTNGNNSSSLLLTTVENSMSKPRAKSNITHKHQQQRHNINTDSYVQTESPENDDEGKNLANKIKKNSSSLKIYSGSSNNNNENDNSINRLKNNILNPPQHQHKSKICCHKEVCESVATYASQDDEQLVLDDETSQNPCVETKPHRHRHKHTKSKDKYKDKEKEKKREKTKDKTKSSRSSSKYHQNNKNDHGCKHAHYFIKNVNSSHHSEMKTENHVTTHCQKVPINKLTITPIFQTSLLGNYCDRHHRYHHNHNKLVTHNYDLEDRKKLQQQEHQNQHKKTKSSNKSKMESEFLNFMAISSKVSDMDIRKNIIDDVNYTQQQRRQINDKNNTTPIKEFSFSLSSTAGSNSSLTYLKEGGSLFPVPSLSSTSSSSEDFTFLNKALSPTSSIALSSINCSDSADSLKASMLELNKMSADLNKKIMRTLAKTSKIYAKNSTDLTDPLEKQTKYHSQKHKHQMMKENPLVLVSPSKNKKFNMLGLLNFQDLEKDKECGNIEVLIAKPSRKLKKQRKNRNELDKKRLVASSERKFKSLPRVLNSGKESNHHCTNDVDLSGLSVGALSYCVDCSSLVTEEVQQRDRSVPCGRHELRLVVDKFDMNSSSKIIVNGSCPMLRSSENVNSSKLNAVRNVLSVGHAEGEESQKDTAELSDKVENDCENEEKERIGNVDNSIDKEDGDEGDRGVQEDKNKERRFSGGFHCENDQSEEIDMCQEQCKNDDQPIRKILEKIVESKLQSIAALGKPVEIVESENKDNEELKGVQEEKEADIYMEREEDDESSGDNADETVPFDQNSASSKSEVESDSKKNIPVTCVVVDLVQDKNNVDYTIDNTSIIFSDGFKVSSPYEENRLEVDSLMNIEESTRSSDISNCCLTDENKRELNEQHQGEDEDKNLENDETTSIESENIKFTLDENNSKTDNKESIIVEITDHVLDNFETLGELEKLDQIECAENYSTFDSNGKVCLEDDCLSSKDDNSQVKINYCIEEINCSNVTLPVIISPETETNIINRTVYKVLEKAQEIVAAEYMLCQPKLTDQSRCQNEQAYLGKHTTTKQSPLKK